MAKKDVTAIVSGAGWIASFADKLIKALREKGVSDEQIHKLVTEDGDVPVAKIAEAVAKATKAIGNTFRLVVDYDQPFDRMLYNLDCGYVNSNITEKNFPSKESGSKEVEFVLYHPNRVASSNEVLKGMEDLNLRPATLKELSAFGTRYPALQREFPIVALGSVWQFWRGGRRVPVLWDGGGERYLLLFWYDSDWDSRYRFLAVRKS